MQHRPPSEAVGGELGPLLVVEVEGVESLAVGGASRQNHLVLVLYSVQLIVLVQFQYNGSSTSIIHCDSYNTNTQYSTLRSTLTR